MNTMLLQAAQSDGGWSFIIMMVVIFAIMWFFMIRPQKKQQKEIQNFRRALKAGDEVITAGGIYGKIKKVNDNDIELEVSPNVKIRVAMSSVFPDAATQQTSTAGK